MDDYTALHRHLGRPRGPVDDDLLDAAVEAHLEETDDLDWKKPQRDADHRTRFIDKDFPEDVAAFANAGGGTIVIGVDERNGAATERVDASEWTDADLRKLRAVAASRLHPPVLGLRTHRLNEGDKRALIVVVPASLDRPHLIQNNQHHFAARVRDGSGSRWMNEREIAEAYRGRFTGQRDAAEALNRLYEGACVGLDSHRRVWGIVAARPRIPLSAPAGFTRDEARELLQAAGVESEAMLRPEAVRRELAHPLGSVDPDRIRPGLRRWIAPARTNFAPEIGAQAGLHQDGAVTLAAALGDHRVDAWTFASWRMEGLVADALGLLRTVAGVTGSVEYETRIGLAPWGPQTRPTMIAPNFDYGPWDDPTGDLDVFEPVDTTITLDNGPAGLLDQARQLAMDCINQGGIDQLMALRTVR